MHAAGKQQIHIHRLAGREGLHQHINRLLPQHKTGARPDMAAAFMAFKNEPFRAAFKEQLQQSGRGDMQKCRNSRCFQCRRLIGPAPGDQGEFWRMVQNDLRLLGPQFFIDKAQNADAPGPRAQHFLGLRHKGIRFGRAHQRQGEEGQSAALGHGQRKFGAVADPRHWALNDGKPCAMRLRQGTAFGQSTLRGGFGHLRGHLCRQCVKGRA